MRMKILTGTWKLLTPSNGYAESLDLYRTCMVVIAKMVAMLPKLAMLLTAEAEGFPRLRITMIRATSHYSSDDP